MPNRSEKGWSVYSPFLLWIWFPLRQHNYSHFCFLSPVKCSIINCIQNFHILGTIWITSARKAWPSQPGTDSVYSTLWWREANPRYPAWKAKLTETRGRFSVHKPQTAQRYYSILYHCELAIHMVAFNCLRIWPCSRPLFGLRQKFLNNSNSWIFLNSMAK